MLKSTSTAHLQQSTMSVSSYQAVTLKGNTRWVVTLGSEALNGVLSAPGTASVLAVLISKASFEAAMNHRTHMDGRIVSAIFSDPDPLKQVVLVKELHGPTASSVLIHSPTVNTYINDYQEATKALAMNLNLVKFE